MRAILFVSCLCAGLAPAQEPAKPADLTAEQILEKSIEASGGRAALQKFTSRHSKGTLDVTFAGMTADAEFFAKAPDKQVFVMTMEGYGERKQGYDGKVGWIDDPMQGLQEMSGDMLDQTKRQSDFYADLKWKEQYPKVELKGKEKVGDRDAYVIVMTPETGKPVTRMYDAETFLLAKQVMATATPEGEVEVATDLSDYKEVDGCKMPHTIKQSLPMGDIIIKFTKVEHNVPIDDAIFAKPGAAPAPAAAAPATPPSK